MVTLGNFAQQVYHSDAPKTLRVEAVLVLLAFRSGMISRPGVSTHRGYPVFNGAHTTVRALSRACERERSRPTGDIRLRHLKSSLGRMPKSKNKIKWWEGATYEWEVLTDMGWEVLRT